MNPFKILFLFSIVYVVPPQQQIQTDTSPPTITNIVVVASTNPNNANMLLATITLDAYDVSGVASITMYYRKTSRNMDYRVAGGFKLLVDNTYILYSKPFHKSQYEYRIIALDNYGNYTCTADNLALCPGGLLWVR